MRKEMLAVGVALTLVATAFGASAFTSTTVDTSSSIQVVDDSNALVGLQDQTNGDIVDTNGGRLVIKASNSMADGVNQNSTVEIGNFEEINSNFNASDAAFSLTNNASTSQDYTISYDGYTDDNDVENVNFTVVDAENGVVTSVNETSEGTLTDIQSGHTRYVLVRIDTTKLSSGDDINGTLSIEATSSA